MRLLFTILLLFNVAQAQVPIGDTIYVKMAVALIDTTSYYRVYYSNGSVKQNQALWKDVRVPKGGSYEELDYKGGQLFSSKGYAVNVTIDSLGNMETIQYLGLDHKPFPAPYVPMGMDYPRGGTAPKKQ